MSKNSGNTKAGETGASPLSTDLLSAFAQDQARRGLQPTTIATRRRILYSLDAWLDVPLAKASSEQIEGWLDSCRLSSRSRYTYLSTVACWFEFLRRRGLRTDDPTEPIMRPRLSRLVPRPANAQDVEFAIDQAEPMMRAWLCLAAYQGFRCVEIARLRREDILEDQTPPLIVVAQGKGGHQAVLTLNDRAELALREYGLPKAGHLFLCRDQRPYKPSTVSRYIGKHMRSLGIEATAHSLRHLFGSTLWAQTHDLRLTQEMLRHADPRTTSGYTAYDRQEAAKVMRGLRLSSDQMGLLPRPQASADRSE